MTLPEIRVYGRHVAEADVREVGEAMCDLLHEVGLSMGFDVRWNIPRVEFMCDGCGHRQPFAAPRYGWTHRHGDDFCSACSSVTSL